MKKKIAIITVSHNESALCLAKYIAKLGYLVDYYCVNCSSKAYDHKLPGFEYFSKSNWGLHRLKEVDCPEIFDYFEGYSVNLSVIGFNMSRRYTYLKLDKWILWKACRTIKSRHYDAIDIVGQMSWVADIHRYLRGENVTHTFHEIGSHQNNIESSKSVDSAINDGSKVILHSNSTAQRFASVNKGKCNYNVIPFGKFETVKLYVKSIQMNIPLDLSKPTFLFYGFILPYKGLDLLWNSILNLKDLWGSFNLIIAGSGSDKTLPDFKSLSNCYVLNRFLDNDEMMHLIEVSSVIVLPYHTASQTGIIPTIALYNKPVIATNVGAFSESISNEINGILVEPENSRSFADAMRRCINDKSLLKKLNEGMGRYGQGDQYDWNIISEKTIKYLFSHE